MSELTWTRPNAGLHSQDCYITGNYQMAVITFSVATLWAAIWIILTQHSMIQTSVKVDQLGDEEGVDPTLILT